MFCHLKKQGVVNIRDIVDTLAMRQPEIGENWMDSPHVQLLAQ